MEVIGLHETPRFLGLTNLQRDTRTRCARCCVSDNLKREKVRGSRVLPARTFATFGATGKVEVRRDQLVERQKSFLLQALQSRIVSRVGFPNVTWDLEKDAASCV